MDSRIWTDMFQLGLPIAEKIVRPVLVYAFLIVGLRLAGKRELAQLNTFDLVVLLLLSNVVQNAIIGEDNSVTGGLIGAATLLVVNHVVVRFLFRHEQLDRVIEGEPDVLIDDGRLLEDRLTRGDHHARGAGGRGAQAGVRLAGRRRAGGARVGRRHHVRRQEAEARGRPAPGTARTAGPAGCGAGRAEGPRRGARHGSMTRWTGDTRVGACHDNGGERADHRLPAGRTLWLRKAREMPGRGRGTWGSRPACSRRAR